MKISRMLISIVLGLVISTVPMIAVAKDKLKSDEFQAQGALQEVITKGSGNVMIDNVMYKVAPHAKIREGGNPIKLRHLDPGLDLIFIYKEGKKSDSKPVISSINVIMK